MHYNVAMRHVGLAIMLVILPGGAVQAAPEWGVAVEVGPELDTNAYREVEAEGSTLEPLLSGLVHLMARGLIRFRPAKEHLLSLEYGGGGKLFWLESARDADEAVQYASLGWSMRVSPTSLLALDGSYYDAWQRLSQRDFRTGAGLIRFNLGHRPTGVAATFHLGYRGLEYKPDADLDNKDCVDRTVEQKPTCIKYSFQGPLSGASLKWALTSGRGDALVDWTLGLSYAVAFRNYTGLLRGGWEKDPFSSSSGFYFKDRRREDLNHLIHVQVNYLGAAEATLWYSAEINDSNNFGVTYVRHAVGLKFTTSLLWGVYLTAKGVLQLSQWQGPLDETQKTGQSIIDFEEENRSSFMLQLSRDLAEHWSLSLRYSLYVNESASRQATTSVVGGSKFAYFRQTLFLGVRFQYGVIF